MLALGLLWSKGKASQSPGRLGNDRETRFGRVAPAHASRPALCKTNADAAYLLNVVVQKFFDAIAASSQPKTAAHHRPTVQPARIHFCRSAKWNCGRAIAGHTGTASGRGSGTGSGREDSGEPRCPSHGRIAATFLIQLGESSQRSSRRELFPK